MTGQIPQPAGATSASAPDAAVWSSPRQTPAAPTPQQAWPYAGPYQYPQQQVPPPPPRRGRGGWIVIGASAVLAVAAVGMGAVDLAKPSPTPTTTTVTAAPPAFPPDQVAAAKKESCAASLNAAAAMTAATQQLANAGSDRNSPQWQAALANVQNVVMVETTYLELHTPPATPPEVANPTREFINSYRDGADALTRGLNNSEQAARTTKAADALNKACG